MRWSRRAFAGLMVGIVALGCSTAPPAPDGSTPCARDTDCDDGLFCNGPEVCDLGAPTADARGCRPSAPPCVAGACDESGERCTGDCEDADGDGMTAMSCGGADCDDTDPRRSPGAVEVCDREGIDEDCDPETFGFRDLDGDGDVSDACCNGTLCGTDCDDMRPGTNPRVPEVCDGLDNDCDTGIDEGVTRVAYADLDVDGYGDPTAPVMVACGSPDGVENGLDCDDGDPAVRPGAAELCNGRDDNCDGVYDVDVDGDGHLSARSVCTGGELPRDDCNDLDPDTYLDADELCDVRDNDCDGTIDDRGDADRACRVDGIAAGFCLAGRCTLASCEDGRADCDGRADTGCEVSTRDDPDHCGACNERCAFGTTCVAGACEPVRAIDLDVGSAHTCFVTERGHVGCFGRNLEGQLGAGAAVDIPTPVEVPGITDATTVDAGLAETCALVGGGALACWGSGSAAIAAPDDLTFSSLSLSDEGGYACATATGGGALWCWGYGQGEPLGLFYTPAFDTGLAATRLATSTLSTCMLDAAGRATCRGMNRGLQLGDGLADHGRICTQVYVGPVPFPLDADCSVSAVTVTAVPALDAITAGFEHFCGHDARDVWCWGTDGSGSPSATPRVVLRAPAATTIRSADAGTSHSCVVLSDGTAMCWGANGSGQLGDGTRTSRTAPVVVGGGHAFDLVRAGAGHSCGIDDDGMLWCWGLGGNGVPALRDLPAPVIGLDPGTATAGSGDDMCARTRAGRVVCWGRGRAAPAVLPGLEGVVELAGGELGLCARDASGSVSCWRGGAAPAPVIDGASAISVGFAHACAIVGGAVSCWGENGDGQLGDGTTTSSITPVAVPGTEGAVEVAAGQRHTCARLASGRVLCWGNNDRVQLGDPTATSTRSPVAVPSVDDAIRVVAGAFHTCAIRSDHTVLCWGDDDVGQLGDGPVFGTRLGARPVLALAGVRSLSAGARHTCALLENAQVWCWGADDRGEAGQPLSRSVDVPTRVPGVAARAIGSGTRTTCAVGLGPTISCWGSNEHGELGDVTGDLCNIICVDSCWETDCGRAAPTTVLGI